MVERKGVDRVSETEGGWEEGLRGPRVEAVWEVQRVVGAGVSEDAHAIPASYVTDGGLTNRNHTPALALAAISWIS